MNINHEQKPKKSKTKIMNKKTHKKDHEQKPTKIEPNSKKQLGLKHAHEEHKENGRRSEKRKNNIPTMNLKTCEKT